VVYVRMGAFSASKCSKDLNVRAFAMADEYARRWDSAVELYQTPERNLTSTDSFNLWPGQVRLVTTILRANWRVRSIGWLHRVWLRLVGEWKALRYGLMILKNNRPWEKCPDCGKRWVSRYDLGMRGELQELQEQAEERTCACGESLDEGVPF
jgi:hypothetical protein